MAAAKIPLAEITGELIEIRLAGLGERGPSTTTIDTYCRAVRRLYNLEESAEDRSDLEKYKKLYSL